VNIRLLKKFDSVIGHVSASLFPSPTPAKQSNPIASLLLIRPGGIGDAVLLAPAIYFLKNTYPTLRITVLAEQRNVGAFLLIPGVDNVLCYDRCRDFILALRGRYDVVVDTEQWHRLSAVVARITSAPLKIGFATNERQRMFTHRIPYSHDDYEATSFTNLLKPMGIETGGVETSLPFLSVPEAASSKAAILLSSIQERPFVLIFPGASIPERQWGADRFRRVAEMLSVFRVKIVVVGGKADYQQGEVIVGGGLGLNLAGATSLAETAALIQKSSLLLSGDSGVLHIAVGLGVATVSLFGPGRERKWAPQGGAHTVINKELPCSPCTTFGNTPPCPIAVRCMQDISVDEVLNVVTMVLTGAGVIQSRCCKRDWIEVT
jgi:ADP-heptose:LPS heptosyltransferase